MALSDSGRRSFLHDRFDATGHEVPRSRLAEVTAHGYRATLLDSPTADFETMGSQSGRLDR